MGHCELQEEIWKRQYRQHCKPNAHKAPHDFPRKQIPEHRNPL